MLFIKKVNFVVYLTVAIVVGFGFGCLIRTNSIQDDLLAANIAKASLYNNQKEDPALSVVEEKLKNDTEFRESTIEIMDVLKNRMAGLNELTERTLQTCSEIPDFIELNTTFASLQTKAYNTNLAIESTTSGIEKIMNGKSAPEYEVATNNVYIGYQKINKQLEAGKQFVDTAEEYLKNNMESENAPAVAELVTDWSVYCAEDAVLSGKDDEYAYWDNRYTEVFNEVLSNSTFVAHNPGVNHNPNLDASPALNADLRINHNPGVNHNPNLDANPALNVAPRMNHNPSVNFNIQLAVKGGHLNLHQLIQ